ncbi:MAG TPA: ArsB/NhaD family transporter [Blastocatellia bacterium]
MTGPVAAISSTSILAAALILIGWRPRGLNIAWPASVAASFVIMLRLVSAADLKLILSRTWDAALTLIALMMISAALDGNGFFEWAARHLLRKARGSGVKAFLYVIALTVVVTALLANDGAVLILTPIFCRMLKSVGIPPRKMLPYLFAAGFLADAASTPLIASNLTNIIIADSFQIRAASFAATMFAPTATVIVAAGWILYLQYRRDLPQRYALERVPPPDQAVADRKAFAAGWIILAGMAIGYPVAGMFRLPVSLVAIVAALALLAYSGFRKVLSIKQATVGAPWYILVYALGMFVIVLSCWNTGPIEAFGRLISGNSSGLTAGLSTGMATGLLSAIANNLPAALAGVLALGRGSGHIVSMPPLPVYSLVLGVDVGGKLTPIGSLATLLWMDILGQYGINIGWTEYIKRSLLITIVTLTAALGALTFECVLR